MGNKRQTTEKSMQILFFGIATASITILFLIIDLSCSKRAFPIFKTVSLHDFVFGKYWYPTSEPADFGVFPLIVASLAVTVVSALVSIPLGVMTAVYLSEIASKQLAEIVKPVVELLAALPSVVIRLLRHGSGRPLSPAHF